VTATGIVFEGHWAKIMWLEISPTYRYILEK